MRAFKAIVKNAFRNGGAGGATASLYAGVAMALSGIVLFSIIVGAWFYSFRWYFARPEPPRSVIIYNAPEAFKEFDEETEFSDYKFVYKTHPYIYDVSTFSSIMKKWDSKLTIVFDDDGNILTFYPAEDLEYTTYKDDFKSDVLDLYANYLKNRSGYATMTREPIEIFAEGVESPDSDSHIDPFMKTLAYMLIPLLFFIAALYSSMTKGTNVIAGAKEQNAFAAILMTPTPRIVLVLGNIVGVWMASMIPALILTVMLIFSPYSLAGALLSLLMMAVLSFFIASLVIMISVMSNNVITAQTAFLPVFLIFITVCITSMQNPEEYFGVYEYLPLYGQYLGISCSLLFSINIGGIIGSSLSTLLLAFICIIVSVKLLGSERFTVSVMSASDKEIVKARKQAERDKKKKSFLISRSTVFGYQPKSSLNDVSFSLTQLMRPLILLSLFQFIALIPPLLMTNGEYLTSIMYSLKAVDNVSDVLTSGASIIGVLMSTPAFLLSMGFGYILIDIYYCLRVRIFERTPLASGLGLSLKPVSSIIKKYLIGMAVGTGMIGCVFLILLISGQINVTGFGISSSSVLLFISFIFMWLFQGACEEIMFRGYMMPRIAARYGLVPAIAISSVLFCLFHAMNPGFGIVAFINLVLISVLYALIAYYTDSIWIVCAAHTMWNFTQGNIFGLEVSGNTGNVSVIHTVSGANADPLITGGGFGPEGGLAVTAVTVVAIVVVVLLRKKIKRTSV